MRGAGRTPRGLRAHQQTSRAAGGTTKSVAPTKLAEATPNNSKTRADATQPSARIARRTASGPRLRRVRIQGRVIRNGRPPNQAERRSTSDAPTKSPSSSQRTANPTPPLSPISKGANSIPFQRVHVATRPAKEPHPDGETRTAGDLEVGFFGAKMTLPTSISNEVQRVLMEYMKDARQAPRERVAIFIFYTTKQTNGTQQ